MVLSLWIVILPIVAALVWNVLDCNPTLYVYDKVMAHEKALAPLAGKTIWLTGASSGIGASMVCQLMEAGAGHVILSSRNRKKLEQVAENCKESTGALTQVSIVPYDAGSLLDADSVDATVDSALAFAAGSAGIDILMLNAGIYQTQGALNATKQERDYITRVNYQAPVDMAQSLMIRGKWKERGYGQIVVVSSIMAKGPVSLASTYAASKAAVKSYFHTLSTEEYSWLRVDVACPGATATGLWLNAGDGAIQASAEGVKMTPDRVAHLILMGMTGPYWLFYETWVTKISGLLYIYTSHYTPTLFHFLVHVLGAVRLAVFEHEQLDVVDIKTMIEKAILLLFGKYP